MSSNVVLITGASTGFGRDTAETLKRAEHIVFASMRDPQLRNREHADALRKRGIEVVELDVTSDVSVEEAVRSVLAKAGRIDVLVNNAGVLSVGVTEAFTSEQAQALFNVNVFGLLRATRAVLPAMRSQRRGLIVNVGSIVGRVTFPFFGLYGASKFAIEALTDSLRYEVSQLGIEVVLVQPSAYKTPMYERVAQPVDGARVSAYGKVGEIPNAMFEHFNSVFESPSAPNPHDVADAITQLIAQSKGNRATRTVVGAAFGADQVNDQTAPVQAHVIAGLGLGHLATVA